MTSLGEHPIPVTRPSLPPLDESVESLRDIWDRRWLTSAPASPCGSGQTVPVWLHRRWPCPYPPKHALFVNADVMPMGEGEYGST
jgi:hypothetical protein